MIPSSVRFYNPQGVDRVAVVSVQPAWTQPDAYLLQLARGPKSGQLGKGTVYGPYSAEQLDERLGDVTASLKAEGFLPAGLHALLSALQDPNSAVRGRAAARLGWQRRSDPVEALLAALPDAVDDVCPILDALGAIGDPRAIPVLRQHMPRKLLSRRRSAVEALRNFGDTEGLAEARKLALERLPTSVRQILETSNESADGPAVLKLVEAIQALDVKEQGLAWDTLYELATPAAVAAVRHLLREIPFEQAHRWRYVKSVLKRSMLRHDYATFGELIHALEIQGRASKGTTAEVRSGYDGVPRTTPIFCRKTQNYLRRLAWRHLRMLAAHRPEAYAHAAAEALIHYTTDDAQEPKGLVGQFASCYLLHQILWGSSKRFRLHGRTLVFRYENAKSTQAPLGIHEEAFPHLWDQQPRAYLRVLGAARLPEVHAFAVRAIQRDHRAVLETASLAEVLPLLQAPYEPTVQLGLVELARRFDPQNPNWSLLGQLLVDERPMARDLEQRWLRLTAPLWLRDPDRITAFLTAPDATTRALAAELVVAGLGPEPALRQALAQRLLAILKSPEAVEGAHEGCARVAQAALIEKLDALLTTADLVTLVSGGSPSAQAVAGNLLGRRPGAVAELGLERIAALAEHPIAAVRAAAQALLQTAEAQFRSDPSLLFVLVESAWDDTRAAALDLLRTSVDPATLGLEGLMGLVDSNQIDIQNLGQELVRLRPLSAPEAQDLVFRLVQHPHPNMRRFTLDLAVGHLPDGAEALARLDGFLRAALFDLAPDRQAKRQAIDFLTTRGLRDEHQARVAVGILNDVVRVQGQSDFEHALVGLTRLKLAYPEVPTPVGVHPGGDA